jgi:hypothetical protein
MSNPAPITLQQLFRFYRPGLPHQAAAIAELEADILTAGYSVAMRRDRPWFRTWSVDGKQPDPLPVLTVPAQQEPWDGRPYGNPLQVPWYAQMDSADRAQAARMCFSSSCAMLLQYMKPGTLSGGNGDDQYLKRVLTYGDTTDAKAQVRALSSFGVKAKFVTTAGWGDIERQINGGIPVPCGFLHRGPVTAPGGGGHWLIVVGYTDTHMVVHDPFGEADLVNGTTLGGVARFARYSRQNFGRRWMVEGPGTGWAIIAER